MSQEWGPEDELAYARQLSMELTAPPGGVSAAALNDVVLADLDGDGLLAALRASQELVNWAFAQQARVLAELAERRGGSQFGSLASRAVADEVGLELAITRQAAERRLGSALVLTAELPATLAAMASGVMDVRKADIVIEAVTDLPAALRGVVEVEAAATAGWLNPTRFKQEVTRAVLRVDAAGAARRVVRRQGERRVLVSPVSDGMCELWALLPLVDGLAVRDCLDGVADAPRQPGDERTTDQRRADGLVEAITGHTASRVAEYAGSPRRPRRRNRPHVIVTASLEALIGASEEPGTLTGYGPIPARTARDLAAEGTWRCAVTDGVHGTLLGLGTSTFTPSYTPTAALRRHLQTRDQVCRFPGCNARATRTDVDHRQPWSSGPGGGATCECNGQLLCGHHHRLKHESDFRVTTSTNPDDPPGTLTWTTPSGRQFTDRPARLHPGTGVVAGPPAL